MVKPLSAPVPYHASTSVSQVDCPASGERYSKETPVPPARKSAAQVVSVRPSDWPRKEAVVTGIPLTAWVAAS